MYATVCSADVQGGPPDIRSANRTADVHETIKRTLVFGIPSG
jgi:hypothetical protein